MSNRVADVARLREELARNPKDRVAWHNLAAAFGDLGRASEAEEAARHALALGIKAPETHLVLARALQSQRRLDDAERAYEAAIALRPAYVDAQRDLAQLVWMRTGEAPTATRRLDKAIRAAPRQAALHLVRSVVLEFAGDRGAALEAAESGLARAGADWALLQQAARLAAETGDTTRALAHAQRSVELAPSVFTARSTLCEVLLACGRLDEAAPIAAALCAAQPLNQYALALQATVWRLQADPRYAQWHDYGTLVAAQTLDVPPGYTSLETFLDELTAELTGLHSFRSHPLQQSVRGGSQLHLQNAELERPLIGALFRVLIVTVQAYVAQLGPGADPVRSRNTGKVLFTGAWSVRLRSGGFHADHVHPHGWLSSACYVALPPTIGQGGRASVHGSDETGQRAGWLRLGRPSFATVPALRADHHVKPERGRLVLFPAYMWHGVEPFESETPRLSVAFDVAPG
jgi:uncharacterized protein (TIGR02466 family)